MADIKIINGEITSITQGIEFNDTTNTAFGIDSAAFGNTTTASGNYSFTSGALTTATNQYSWAGGYDSDATGDYAFVFGRVNIADGTQSAVLGGLDNVVLGTGSDATNSGIFGGTSNVINGANVATSNSGIFAGSSNRIINGPNSIVQGGFLNTISGGTTNGAQYCSILGGQNNQISGTSTSFNSTTIVGGQQNKINGTTNGTRNTIIGGTSNTINGANDSTIINGTSITLTESNTTYIGGIRRGGYVLSNTLTSAVSSSSVTPALVSGWQFTAVANAIYKLTVIGTYQTAATTTGGRLKIGGTATCNVAGMFRGGIASTAVATELAFPATTMTSEFITTGVSAINTPHHIGCDVIFRCTVGGTIQIEWGSEVAASAAQLNIGSSIIVERIN